MTSTSDQSIILAVIKKVEILTRTIASFDAALTRDLSTRVKEKIRVKTRKFKFDTPELHEAALEHRRILVDALEDFTADRKNMVEFMQEVEDSVDFEEVFQRVFTMPEKTPADSKKKTRQVRKTRSKETKNHSEMLPIHSEILPDFDCTFSKSAFDGTFSKSAAAGAGAGADAKEPSHGEIGSSDSWLYLTSAAEGGGLEAATTDNGVQVN
jgi:hypothetical protein